MLFLLLRVGLVSLGTFQCGALLTDLRKERVDDALNEDQGCGKCELFLLVPLSIIAPHAAYAHRKNVKLACYLTSTQK